MGFAENVLNKIRGTPAFKPASVNTFGNWAIEAGDIISVDNDGVVETMPIFSSDMNWSGSAIATIACTGNQKREIQDKQDRKDYAMSSGLYGYMDEKVEKLYDSFGVELGNVRSALDVYVKDTEDLQKASAKLTTKVDGAEAKISLNAKKIDDVASSMATIEADVVKLKGRVDVTGRLSVEDGGIRVNGNIKANGDVDCGDLTLESKYINLGGNLLTLQGNVIMSADGINLDGKIFSPKEITSTSGAVLALGTA